jgi:hydrogenase maturation protease
MTTRQRILIGGVGNIFLGDDGFGPEVVRYLAQRTLPSDVALKDFGIRGRDLAYEIAAGYEAVILIDAMEHSDKPGTLYVLEPEIEDISDNDAIESQLPAHHMDLLRVFRSVLMLGGQMPCLRLIGCEPASLDENNAMSLSPVVQAAIEPAVELVLSVLDSIRERCSA